MNTDNIRTSPLQGFLSELSSEKRAFFSTVVDDNAKRHIDESLENSFSRLPPTPSGSFQRRQMNRWNDSLEIIEQSSSSLMHYRNSPHPSSASADPAKLSPCSDLLPPSRRKSRSSIADMIGALPMERMDGNTNEDPSKPPSSRW